MNSCTISNVVYLKTRYNYSYAKIAELVGINRLQVQYILAFAKEHRWQIPEQLYPSFAAALQPASTANLEIVRNLQVICHILYADAIKKGANDSHSSHEQEVSS